MSLLKHSRVIVFIQGKAECFTAKYFELLITKYAVVGRKRVQAIKEKLLDYRQSPTFIVVLYLFIKGHVNNHLCLGSRLYFVIFNFIFLSDVKQV